MLKNMEHVLCGRGGSNRWKIMKLLHERPYNPNELSKMLKLNYRTITFHLEILKEYDMIEIEGSYGKLCSLTEVIELDYKNIQEFIKKIGY